MRSASISIPAALLIMVGTCLTSACMSLAKRSYPSLDVEDSLPGLSGPMTIHIDALGVPHIFAANDDDAAQGVGYMHGRDRGFHLELIRLASQGRLSELLGSELLQVDRRLRLLSYQLDESFQSLPARELQRLEAYCQGINRALERSPRPLEFKVLGHKPQPWLPRDVLAVARLQAWDLSVDAGRELVRAQVAASSPARIHSWLFRAPHHMGNPIIDSTAQPSDGPPFDNAVPMPPPAALESANTTRSTGLNAGQQAKSALHNPSKTQLTAAIAQWVESSLGDGNFVPGGSNGWAVSGQKTSDGHAIVAGDPHLAFRWPAVFYEVHVQTPEVDYSGATFPGLPMVVIGQAAEVAWTLTTSYADVQDLFELKLNPEDPSKYLLDGQMEALIPWEQSFKVKKQVLTETYYVSEFGPIFNYGREDKIPEGKTYALSWPGFSPQALPMTSTFDALYRATTPQESISAIRMLPTPSQNWIFANPGGHIGWVLGGKLPHRRASPLPQDGSNRNNLWPGFQSEAARPVVVDPESGYLVASNQAILPDTGYFNTSAGGQHRAARTANLLKEKTHWTRDEMRALQMDTVSLEAAQILPLILTETMEFLSANPPSEHLAQLEQMGALLESWDYNLAVDEAAPLIWHTWLAELKVQLFSPWIDDPAALQAYLRSRLGESPTYEALFTPEGKAYFDDPTSQAIESRTQVLASAFIAAQEQLAELHGQDIQQWNWGSVHTLTLEHPFTSSRLMRRIFAIDPMALPGGRHSLFALGFEGMPNSYEVLTGPALRQVASPGQGATFVLAGGNAGQPKHPFGTNQLEDWAQGRQHTAGGNKDDIAARAVGSLHFTASP